MDRVGRCAVLALVTAMLVAFPRAEQAGRNTAAATPAARPRLIVLVVIDQFRADYLDWYGTQWVSGLQRVLSTGALFPRAGVPYAISKTCAGHATIGTGSYPSRHGMIDNDWYDPRRRALVPCTSDVAAESIGLGGGEGVERHSGASLAAPAFADELRRQSPQPPRVVSLALKARAAISLGGHGGPGTIVLWEEDSGAWATSTAFASAPWPEVDQFIRDRPTTSARGQLWNRLLPAARYVNDDRAPGEPSAPFPHPLNTPLGVPFAAIWDASPWADAYLGDMASAIAERVSLGRRDATDFLAIGFSALDYVGHSYGPRSHEVQDMLIRLDGVLGRLLGTLDRLVGPDKYVLALTSDHGVALLPDQAASVTGVPGGRVSVNALALAIETALGVQFGQRPYIEAVTGTYVHFLPGVLDQIRASAQARTAVAAAAEAVPGIERVFWSWDLANTSATDDARLVAMRRSYFAGRSGDLAYQPEANWVVASGGTNHGSWHPYDREVPMAFVGVGIKPGRYTTAATIADVAPTLAALAGITLPQADGRALSEVLAP